MKKSLIGQSEVLVICGTFLAYNGNLGWGIGMIATGVAGAVIRFVMDFQILLQEKETLENRSENPYEKVVGQLLSESFNARDIL